MGHEEYYMQALHAFAGGRGFRMQTAAIETRHSTWLTDAVILTRASALYCSSMAARYRVLWLSDRSALE